MIPTFNDTIDDGPMPIILVILIKYKQCLELYLYD
jgi:hypothetical protein